MTYKDLLIWEHPEEINEVRWGGCNGCPSTYGYEKRYCNPYKPSPINCDKCWNREITDMELLESKGLISKEKANENTITAEAVEDTVAMMKKPLGPTYRDLLKLEYPDQVDHNAIGGCNGCPGTYGYENRQHCEKTSMGPYDGLCTRCWDREITSPSLVQRYKGLIAGNLMRESIENTTETFEMVNGSIKDSGDRTEFETGAVRDMHEGKGRCDLMPLDVIGDWKGDEVLDAISYFIADNESGCLTVALEKFCEDIRHWDFPTMLLEVAVHFEEGAKKYGDNNWRKGIPVRCYIDSAVRHYLKYLRGDQDERHDRAFCWNILCCVWTCKHHPELNDYAKKEDDSCEQAR